MTDLVTEFSPSQSGKPKEEIPLAVFHQLIERERVRVEKQLSRARGRGRVATLTIEQWLWVLNAFRYKCACCGQPYTTMEHIEPIADGGGTTMDNVVPCCVECNERRNRVRQENRRILEKLQMIYCQVYRRG